MFPPRDPSGPALFSPASLLLFVLLLGLGLLLNLYGSERYAWPGTYQWGFPYICATRSSRGAIDVSWGRLVANMVLISGVSLSISILTERLLLERVRLRQLARRCRTEARTWADIGEEDPDQ